MPITKYQYTISTQTANDKVNGNQLALEIAADPAIIIALDHLDANIEPDKLDVYMADALTAPEETALTAVVLATQGVGLTTTLLGALTLVNAEKIITGDAVWDIMEGLLTTPSFFTSDMSQISARIIGEHKGTGGQLRLVENVDGSGDEEKINPFFEFPDTSGAWVRFKVDSDVVPREGIRNLYRTECRLDGTASLSLRYATISMLKVVVTP